MHFVDAEYGVEARNIQTKCHFMLKDENEDQLESMIRSYRAFLSRNREVSAVVKKSALNFLTFISKLHNYRISLNKDAKELVELSKEMENCHALLDRRWIFEELVKLQKK